MALLGGILNRPLAAESVRGELINGDADLLSPEVFVGGKNASLAAKGSMRAGGANLGSLPENGGSRWPFRDCAVLEKEDVDDELGLLM